MLHALPFTTFGEIAALGFEIEVHCSSCYRQTKVDPADRRLSDRVFAAAPFRCSGVRDQGFAVPLPTLQGTRICLHQAGGAPAGWRRGDADLPVLSPMRAPLVHRAHACRPATLAASGMGSRRPLSLPGLPRQDRLALPWASLAAELFPQYRGTPCLISSFSQWPSRWPA
jgi:hypothetical protein